MFNYLRLRAGATCINRLIHNRMAVLCLSALLICAGVIGLTEPAVFRTSGAESPGVYAVDAAQMNQESLTDYVETQVRPLIVALSGVSKFTRIGGTGLPAQSAFLDGRRVLGFQVDSSGNVTEVADAIAKVLVQLHDANPKLVFTSLTDKNPMLIEFKLAPDSAINFSEERAEAARQRISAIPGVERVFACVGASCRFASSPDAQTLLITLTTGPGNSRSDINAAVNNVLATVPGITVMAGKLMPAM